MDQVSVFKVCDQPHPKLVKEILAACLDGNIHDSHSKLEKLWAKGYSAGDIVQVPSHCFFCAICAMLASTRAASVFLVIPPLLALSAYTGMVCAGQELVVTWQNL